MIIIDQILPVLRLSHERQVPAVQFPQQPQIAAEFSNHGTIESWESDGSVAGFDPLGLDLLQKLTDSCGIVAEIRFSNA